MKVLVTGGRDYADAGLLNAALDKFHKAYVITTLIHGAANGVDTLARLWAERNCVPQLPFHADWQKHGTRAGPIRNQDMLIKGRPNVVLAFPGGRGTANMIGLARDAGVPVEVFEPYVGFTKITGAKS